MKKIFSITLVSALSLVLSTGCSSKGDVKPSDNVATTSSSSSIDAKISKDALFVNTHDNKKIIKAIKRAGEKTGWNITEFKSNEVIAEKTANEDTVSSSIHFSNGHIEFSNPEATSDLRDAVEEECKGISSNH